VGGLHLALAIDGVREVTQMPRISRVPHAPPAMLGLANFRGTVIPVLSAAVLLGSTDGGSSRLIVVDTGELLGLAVDDASRVMSSGAPGTVQLVDIAELAARSMPQRATPRRPHETTTALLADLASDGTAMALVVFAIGDQEFALSAAVVDHIAPLPGDIALRPDADDVVLGNAAFGDAVLPLLSLRVLLALPLSDPGRPRPRPRLRPRPRVIVVQIGGDRIGLVVDAMRGIVQARDDQIDPLPRALRRGHAAAGVEAICRLDQGERLISVLAPDQLVREDITAKMLGQPQSGPEHMADAVTAETEQFLIFQIGSEEFGIPLGAVDAVAQLPNALGRLPNAPAFILGVMNLRGQVIPVIDQGQRLGAKPCAGARRRVIVVRIGELRAGFAVDTISQIVRVDAANVRPAPDLENAETQVFERVVNFAEAPGIVPIVSPRTLLDRAEQDLLIGIAPKGAGTRQGARLHP
jgi:purine-binding chemotaxis protein CheW